MLLGEGIGMETEEDLYDQYIGCRGCRWRGWVCWCIGEGVFIKYDMARNNDATSGEVETPVSFVSRRIA